MNSFSTDETIFSFKFYVYHSDIKEGLVNQTNYAWKLCTQDDFIEDPSEFYRLNLNGTYCFPNETLKLGGFWDEEKIDYFWLELRTCQNSSSGNVICKSPEEIDNYLKNKYVDIDITNHNIDSSNFQNPLKRNLKIFYQMLDPKLYKFKELYMKNSLLTTDDGFFFESLKIINSYIRPRCKFSSK